MNGNGKQGLDVVLEGLIEVQTPDSVVFYHPMAGICRRAAACITDTFFQVVALLFLLMMGFILSGFVEMLTQFVRWVGDVFPVVWVWAVLGILMWLVFTAYYVVFEGLWSGQTPGKRLLRIRVLKDGGGPVGFYEALLRNVMRLLDAMPYFYAVGIISALCTQREQRLGDLVAGTIVVREPKVSPPDPAQLASEVSEHGRDFAALIGLERLDEEDFTLIRDFLERRRQLAPEIRGELSISIATRMARKMAFAPPKPVPAEWFLEAVAYQAMGNEKDRAANRDTEWKLEESVEASAE